jgi:hypothetical protein
MYNALTVTYSAHILKSARVTSLRKFRHSLLSNVRRNNMDLIDRQAAIKTLEKGLPSEPLKSKYTEGITVGFGLAITWIEQLPAVQPQPEEDCDTCKHGYFGDRQCDNCRMRYPSHYEREEEHHD